MKRKDREVTAQQAWEIVDRCTYGVVAMVDENGMPYAVPVNTVREGSCIYFHSAQTGRKADCLRGNPRVCVTFVEDNPAIDQPGLTTRYSSAILFGRVDEITEDTEKIAALRLLCRKLAPENPRSSGDFKGCRETTALWRITAESITGKANRGKPE